MFWLIVGILLFKKISLTEKKKMSVIYSDERDPGPSTMEAASTCQPKITQNR